ncbi:MMPL family transporter [Streptomyces sp. SL13]|uniref:MMPL family transporter n=1 Tax=Streptantibioticus silvisoli TaxID=2705255 RepID=A0AA90H0G2_9ACTN|nr:MMPL family transporter [Streptantibioticus silvisoli]MDI5968738.1 MMPL family transporter [Streptantibioticus silvisoli]
MRALARFVVRYRWWVTAAWVLLAAAGAFAAPRATSALSYDFGLPGRPGYRANQEILHGFGSGGDDAPVLLVAGNGTRPVRPADAAAIVPAVRAAMPGARVASFGTDTALRSRDGRTGVILVYPRPGHGQDPYAAALPALQRVTRSSRVPLAVTGQDALMRGGGGGGAGVLAETVFGGVAALVILLLVFGSALAVMPLVVAAVSILTTFLIMWGLTRVTDVSFIVQYLLALIGLGVAIDYALLEVTRWREERGRGAVGTAAVENALATAGRSVLFSGLTVAVSLASLTVLPVPFLRSVGYTGLLIPLISVTAAITLLPALLVTAGERLEWPRRRSLSPVSRLWTAVGGAVVRHRWTAAVGSALVLLALASPLLGLRLGQPSAASLATSGGPAATALHRVRDAGLGAGMTHPVEIVTADPSRAEAAARAVPGVAGAVAPASWSRGGRRVVDVWTTDDTATAAGSTAARRVRTAVRATGARVGGIPAQDADFITAVYGNVPWIVAVIVVVTFALLLAALRSVWLPVKALVLNVLSLGAAYGVTVLIWQHGVGTEALFGLPASGAVTVWIPIAVFAFLFGLSMDYEVFLLSRIREEYDAGATTDDATVAGVARTGRLVTSAALILFFAFVALSRVPATDVKILATALALGILIDATVVRGVLAPALVALLGRANWWSPFHRRAPARTPGE